MEGMGKKRRPLMVMDSSLTAAAQTASRGPETGAWEWMARERAAVDPVHCLPLSSTTRGEEAAGGGARPGRRWPEDVTMGICCKGPPEEEPNYRRMRCSKSLASIVGIEQSSKARPHHHGRRNGSNGKVGCSHGRSDLILLSHLSL
ncbi:uncharacterized protein LOC119290810 isoform X1 [Triticum dicoccoides]|uniref:uncharacterized protein n=1 Tax=Triticum aestivum TaxID=4565 RepID=UPI00188F9572|nr:uncharacterized protein LOC119290810 isoform X1 [Triticum dicoccoides]XP_044370315.1 uncharacterized protein LOC123092583 [Triticum aestivum]